MNRRKKHTKVIVVNRHFPSLQNPATIENCVIKDYKRIVEGRPFVDNFTSLHCDNLEHYLDLMNGINCGAISALDGYYVSKRDEEAIFSSSKLRTD